MFTSDQVSQLRELVSTAQSILVMLPSEAKLDQIASGMALTTCLEQAGKQVTLLSPTPLGLDQQSLGGISQVHTQLGNRDLTVSFDYHPEAVDKVSYHIDDQQQRFYLVIKPQKGQKPLDKSTVQFTYTGAEADIIFLIGIHDFDSLEQLYFGFEQLYQTAIVVTFHTFEPSIGSFKLDASGTSSLSESMSVLLQGLGYPLIADAATNLLSAIERETDNFQSLAMSAETFEIVAWLMRSGGRRSHRRLNVPQPHEVRGRIDGEVGTTMAKKLDKPAKKSNGKKSSSSEPKIGALDYQPSNLAPGGNG